MQRRIDAEREQSVPLRSHSLSVLLFSQRNAQRLRRTPVTPSNWLSLTALASLKLARVELGANRRIFQKVVFRNIYRIHTGNIRLEARFQPGLLGALLIRPKHLAGDVKYSEHLSLAMPQLPSIDGSFCAKTAPDHCDTVSLPSFNQREKQGHG